jgi:hypothetical protein
MAIESIIAQIDEEIAKLTQIRALLSTTGIVSAKVALPKARNAPAQAKGKKRRVLSPEARKRIADAQRKRWAAQKAKTK